MEMLIENVVSSAEEINDLYPKACSVKVNRNEGEKGIARTDRG